MHPNLAEIHIEMGPQDPPKRALGPPPRGGDPPLGGGGSSLGGSSNLAATENAPVKRPMKKSLFCPNQGGPLDCALLPPQRPPFWPPILYVIPYELAILYPYRAYRPPIRPPQGGGLSPPYRRGTPPLKATQASHRALWIDSYRVPLYHELL
jgi:hypothetical protein